MPENCLVRDFDLAIDQFLGPIDLFPGKRDRLRVGKIERRREN